MTLTSREYLPVNQALFSLAHAYEVRMGAEKERETVGLRLSHCSVGRALRQLSPLNARRLSRAMDINPARTGLTVNESSRFPLLGLGQVATPALEYGTTGA